MIRPPAEILLEIEQECLAADKAIAKRAWPDCERSWSAQRRLTHELEVALRSVERESSEFKLALKRVDRIRAFRDKQLQRLTTFHASLGKRLATMNNFRGFARQAEAERKPRLLDVSS